MKSWHNSLLFGAAFGAVFVLGRWLPQPVPATIQAQGRGPVTPPPPEEPESGEPAAPEVVYAESGGSSDSGNGFVAVTGSYGVGTSVLYVLDTVGRQLAVYEARGGSNDMRRLVLVGARKIDLDLQIESYNDRSEFDYPRLKTLFERRDRKDHEAKSGLEREAGKR